MRQIRLRNSSSIFAVTVVATMACAWSVSAQTAESPAAQVALPAAEKDIPYADGGDQQKLDKPQE